MPAWWGASSAQPAPARSHGCLSAAGVGCVLVLGIAGVAVLAALVGLAGLAALVAGALGG